MFQKDHVFTKVNGRSKNEILQYISEKAEDLQITHDQAGLLTDLLKREDEVSTGLQQGFAIPHTKSSAVQKASLLFLELEQPIDWGSFDDLPTSYLFTLLVPLEEANITHLKLLSGIATSLMEPDFIEKIQPGQTADYYYEVIEQQLKEGITQ
ncbi:PTS glucose transporter subunit IIA [Bacillus australimaris]|uniref:PTS glucose transporter subunit IIA n=1 Tax=Bacillus australimaris TaxID=1326968 RepID=A0ABD4QN24_9BACI|nr:PTS sugar transporter subunit IIA [Bacillus australimaris]KPN12792.1 PTS glucose transporter subunit IIA [Bacillus australimaris]MBR8691458.1 PTS sugar transporter subunit IIA [Bacillus australimaris]